MVEYKLVQEFKDVEISTLYINVDISKDMSIEQIDECINKWLKAINFDDCTCKDLNIACSEHKKIKVIDNDCCILYIAIVEEKTYDIAIRKTRRRR